MKKILFTALLLISTIASAGGLSTGPVTGLVVIANSPRAFFAAGTSTGKAACGATLNNEWAIDLSTAQGRAMYALLLTAQANGKSVRVQGNGTCSLWGDRETVDGIWLLD